MSEVDVLREERQHHIQVAKGEVGRYVLLPGDPGRCELIARRLHEARLVAANREYETWTGLLEGVAVSVTSTGIGCPSTAIAVEELERVGADTFVRVGTAGIMQPDIPPGDLGVITAAIRDEGTSSQYLPIEFPAVADPNVVRALMKGATSTDRDVRWGIAQSKDSFFGQHEPGRMPVADRLQERWRAWVAGGALCSEMEAATLFIVASVLHVRAGAAMLMAGHADGTPMTQHERDEASIENVIDLAIAGLRELIRADAEDQERD